MKNKEEQQLHNNDFSTQGIFVGIFIGFMIGLWFILFHQFWNGAVRELFGTLNTVILMVGFTGVNGLLIYWLFKITDKELKK